MSSGCLLSVGVGIMGTQEKLDSPYLVGVEGVLGLESHQGIHKRVCPDVARVGLDLQG